MTRWLRVRMVLDRVVAAALLVIFSPVIVVLAIAVRLSDRGPSFLAVPRVGRGGEVFKMWKLRSMRAELPDGRATGLALTATDDKRITPVGRRLRAYHLDELPQLWNVVKGEMCLLGARPEAPEFVDTSDIGWQALLVAPPGIAGPTQLIVSDWERHLISACAAGDIYTADVVPVKLAIDRWYLGSASPRLDALVAVTLLRRFMPGTDSSTLRAKVRREVPESHAVDQERRAGQGAPAAHPDTRNAATASPTPCAS
ncbi:MAG: sugar transferase [Aquihabitans sp.]